MSDVHPPYGSHHFDIACIAQLDRCAEVILVDGQLDPLCSWDSLGRAGREWSDRLLPYLRESFLDFVERQRFGSFSGRSRDEGGGEEENVEDDEQEDRGGERASICENEAQVAANIEEACLKAIADLQKAEVKGSKEKHRVKSLITSIEKSSKWCPPTDATASSSTTALIIATNAQRFAHVLPGNAMEEEQEEQEEQDEGEGEGEAAAVGAQQERHHEEGDNDEEVQQGRGNQGVRGQADRMIQHRRARGLAMDNPQHRHLPHRQLPHRHLQHQHQKHQHQRVSHENAMRGSYMVWDSKINSHTFARALVEDILSLKWPDEEKRKKQRAESALEEKQQEEETISTTTISTTALAPGLPNHKSTPTDVLYCPSEYGSSFVDAVVAMNMLSH